MSNIGKKISIGLLVLTMVATVFAGCKTDPVNTSSTDPSVATSTGSSEEVNPVEGDPIKFTLFYSDNATLPFREDWLTVATANEMFNAEMEFEAIPIADYQTKVSLALNTGNNAPDVILYQSTVGENISLATNGALVPVSDYADFTPNFNAKIASYGLEEELAQKNLSDGKRYYIPAIYDQQFYDGGLILREDLLAEYGLTAPTTFDELYDVLKVFKENNPDSYPLTILAGPRVLYRMTMSSFGVSLGRNAASGTHVLSWDYEKNEYFPGAISDEYKEYVTYLHKLYAEGLLDPEMADPIDGDSWSTKMATEKSFATYAYYDQIGGVIGSSEVEGIKLQMYPPLAGPAGAHHQPKSRLGSGIMYPSATAKRDDFEQLVRTVDNIFFSDEGAKLWCLGVEGTTYEGEGDSFKFTDTILNSPDGIYKNLQVQYGAGNAVTQMVWEIDREMTKYDENYAAINKVVAGMPDAIEALPPAPLFDDLTAEEAGSLQTPLADTFEVWVDEFITGKKNIETDWETYVEAMKTLQIEEFAQMYNDNIG